MDKNDSLKSEIRNAAVAFVGDYLQTPPKSISIDLHDADVIVTLHGIVAPVEKEFAHGDAERRALLEKFYGDAFDAAKDEFERTLESIMQRPVESSMLRIDFESGNGVTIVNFAGRAPDESE